MTTHNLPDDLRQITETFELMLFSCKLLNIGHMCQRNGRGRSVLSSLRVRKWNIMAEINITSHVSTYIHFPLYFSIFRAKFSHCGSKDKPTVTINVNFTIYIKIAPMKITKTELLAKGSLRVMADLWFVMSQSILQLYIIGRLIITFCK